MLSLSTYISDWQSIRRIEDSRSTANKLVAEEQVRQTSGPDLLVSVINFKTDALHVVISVTIRPIVKRCKN